MTIKILPLILTLTLIGCQSNPVDRWYNAKSRVSDGLIQSRNALGQDLISPQDYREVTGPMAEADDILGKSPGLEGLSFRNAGLINRGLNAAIRRLEEEQE